MAEQPTPSRRVVTGEARLSYASIWEPRSVKGSDPKYGLAVLIPKNDTATLQKIEAAVQAAIQAGVEKFGNQFPTKPSMLKLPLRDGDAERDDAPYANHFFVNANSKTQPQVVDIDVNPILDQAEVYSGCYGRVSLEFYPFISNGNKGVACGLGNIQKTRDGEPLAGGATAAQDFEAFAPANRGGFSNAATGGNDEDDFLA